MQRCQLALQPTYNSADGALMAHHVAACVNKPTELYNNQLCTAHGPQGLYPQPCAWPSRTHT